MRINQKGGSKGKNFFKPKGTAKDKPSLEKKQIGVTPKRKLSLPDGPSEPVNDLSRFVILGFGEKKIGKTSTLTKFPNAIVLKTEPGGKGLRITQIPEDPTQVIDNWEDFSEYVDLVIADDRYQTLIFDTLDIAYDLCFKHKVKELKISHPNDLPYGQGWDAIKQEFIEVMTKAVTSGKGVILVSHCDDKEFLKPDGERYSKLIPTLSKAAMKWAAGIADIIVYFGYYGSKRYMTIAGSDTLEGGHRLEEHFLTPKGKQVHSIPMGKSSKEAYKNFVDAFNNKQEDVCDMSKVDTGLSDVRAPMVKGRRNG